MSRVSLRSIKMLARSLGGLAVVDTLGVAERGQHGLLEQGDILLELDGVRTRTTLDFVNATSSSLPMEGILLRDGKEVTLHLPGRRASATPSVVSFVLDRIASERRRR